MRIAVDNFKGEIPRSASRLLPDGYAETAINTRLLSGDLTAWKNFEAIQHLCKTGIVNTIYPLRDPLDGFIWWLQWTNDELASDAVEVDVAKSTIAGDTTARTYLTGLDIPRYTNIDLATNGSGCLPIETRPLGVINPDTPPTLEITPDGPNSTTIFDPCDNESAWTFSPLVVTPTVRRQAVVDPAFPGAGDGSINITVTNSLTNAFAYRDTGTQNAAVLVWTQHFFVRDTTTAGGWNAGFRFLNDVNGAGPCIQIGFQPTAFIASTQCNTWDEFGSIGGLVTIGTPPSGTWLAMRITATRVNNSQVNWTAELHNGSTIIASLTGSAIAAGGFFGFTGNNGADVVAGDYTVAYDNLTIVTSGIFDDTSNNIATSYVYTFINDIGEESGPSPASLTVIRDDGTAVIVSTPTSPPSSFDYHVVAKRIYRAVTGATGTAFFLLAEIPITQADYTDVIPDSTAALDPVLPSSNWALPPTNLRGILALPNNIYSGFHGNALDLSAQGFPHAWPVEFRLATDFPIVGIAAIDTMVVICTQGFPYIAYGNTPDAFSMSKIEIPQGCVSKRSIAYLKGVGVLYASPDGVVSVAGPGNAEIITTGLFTRREWQAFRPESMICVAHDNRYFVQYDTGLIKGAFMLETTQNGFGVVHLGWHATAVRADLLTDKLYLVLDQNTVPSNAGSVQDQVIADGTEIHAFDSYEGGSPVLTPFLPYFWFSKLYNLPKPTTFRYARIQAVAFEDLVLVLYAEGQSYFSVRVTNEQEIALPDVPGRDGADNFNFALTGTDSVRTVQFVEAGEEMQ